ncbi:helicase POLQ-like [Ptychodera flava]|uniref:helicase POLQ-like n=1 Tax=Ptychodera flava TaxID=63121 RepID=UPI003969C06C
MADNLCRKVRKRSGGHSKSNLNLKRSKQDECEVNCLKSAPRRNQGRRASEEQDLDVSARELPSTPARSPKLIREIQCKKPLFKGQRRLIDSADVPVPSTPTGTECQDVFKDLATSTPSGERSQSKTRLLSPTASPINSAGFQSDAEQRVSCQELGSAEVTAKQEREETEWGCDDSSFYADLDVSNIVAGAANANADLSVAGRGSEAGDGAQQKLEQCNNVRNVGRTSDGQQGLDLMEGGGCDQPNVIESEVKGQGKIETDHVSRRRNCNNSNNTKTSTFVNETENGLNDNVSGSRDVGSKNLVAISEQTPMTMRDRIKQRLHSNAKTSTPQQNKVQELKQVEIREAISVAKEMERSTSDKDIGPFYGLPSKVKELLNTLRGIDQMYDWQHSCLTLPAISENKNLIYSLPTSGGKTLVAEILIMQQLLCHKKDALFILPFVSIVQEKVRSLSPFAVELGFLVEEYAASKGAMPPRKRRKKNTLYIATIEKAHSLVNCLIQETRIGDVGLVVVDELHMLGEGGRRGATLEMTLTKLMYVKTAQIIGMSATLNNIRDLQDFLHAEIYTSNFRPVELTEYVKIGDNIFKVDPRALCPEEKFVHARTVLFPYKAAMLKEDPDHLVGLVLEVIPKHSCLIFCATKKNCQHVAEMLCRLLSKSLTEHKQKEKKELLAALRRDSEDNLCSTLRRTVPYGIAYHHGGLTMDERKLIEDAYSQGTLCLLTCTSTLAAGVNLPAKRVILRSPYIANQLLTGSKYKQMVGRAGRAGIDTSGESILIIKPKDKEQVLDILSSPLESCHSSLLYEDGKGIRSLVLSIIALQLTCSREAVIAFMKCTLYSVQNLVNEETVDISFKAEEAVSHLIKLGLVKEKQSKDSSHDKKLEVTKLGHAAFKGSIDIDTCPSVYKELHQAAEKGLVVTNTLHLLFLVTPRDMDSNIKIDWMNYYSRFSGLSEAELATANVIGVPESYLVRRAAGQRIRQGDVDVNIVERFFLTLMLWYVLKRHSIWSVAHMFDVPRGFLQNLFSSAATFASSLQRFTEDLPEFWAFQHLLGQIVKELAHCATADLVPLLEIPGVKLGRARQLLKAGFKTLQQLAFTSPETLVKNIEHMPRKLARQIVSAAKMELEERAEALREQAEEMVANPNS